MSKEIETLADLLEEIATTTLERAIEVPPTEPYQGESTTIATFPVRADNPARFDISPEARFNVGSGWHQVTGLRMSLRPPPKLTPDKLVENAIEGLYDGIEEVEDE